MKILLSSSKGIQASKLVSELRDLVLRRVNHVVLSVGAPSNASCKYRSIWSENFSRDTCLSESSSKFFVLNAYREDLRAPYDYCGRTHCHANGIDHYFNVDLKYFGSDDERIKHDNRYLKIMGRYYSEQLSTIRYTLSESVPRFCIDAPTDRREAPNIALAIEKFVAGRALTSPTIVERFHGDGLHRSEAILDCIRVVSKTISDNDQFISEISSGIHNGTVSLNNFRDMFIERILKKNSIGLSVEDLPDVPACMISVGNSKKIYRDKKLNGFERSFAVAHELAHFSFNDKSYLDIKFSNECSTVHTLQEYRSDQFANILLRSLEGIFVALGGQLTQRDYAKGMLDLAAGKRLLKREIVDHQEYPVSRYKSASKSVECDQQLPDQEFAS